MSILKKISNYFITDLFLFIDPLEKTMFKINENAEIKYSFEMLESELIEIFKALLKVPDHITQKISHIIILNTGNENSEFTNEKRADLFSKLKKTLELSVSTNKTNKLLDQLYKSNFISIANDLERSELLELTRNKNIIFFDFTLTQVIINHIYLSIDNCKIIGYQLIEDKQKYELEEISNVRRYLSLAYSLTVVNVSVDDKKTRVKRVQELCEEYFQQFLEKVATNPKGKFLVLLNNDTIPSFPTVRSALKNTNDAFYFIECPPGSNQNIPDYKNIFIKDIQKLPDHKVIDLIELALHKENRDKQIIMHSTRSISLKPFGDLIFYPFFSLQQASELFRSTLEMQSDNVSGIQRLADDLERVLVDALGNQKSVKKKSNELKELRKISRYADREKINFWYKMDSLQQMDLKIRRRILLEQMEKYYSDSVIISSSATVESDWIKFEHLGNKKDWIIYDKNGKIKYGSQSYKNSKGLKFIALLVKNYEYPNEIKIEDLLEKINKWHGQGTGRDYETPKIQLVTMIIRKDLEKIDKNLLILINDFRIDDFCYYKPQGDFRILIEDDNIPI